MNNQPNTNKFEFNIINKDNFEFKFDTEGLLKKDKIRFKDFPSKIILNHSELFILHCVLKLEGRNYSIESIYETYKSTNQKLKKLDNAQEYSSDFLRPIEPFEDVIDSLIKKGIVFKTNNNTLPLTMIGIATKSLITISILSKEIKICLN